MPEMSLPYGDAFLFNTPYTDRAANLLYQEQKLREAQRRQAQKQMDDQFAMNLAKIRDPDVDKATKLYGEWKANSQMLEKSGMASPADQLKNIALKGALYKHIFKSQKDKAEEEDLAEDMKRNWQKYDKNAYQLLTERRKRSVDDIGAYTNEKGEPIDLYDLNTYRYKGTNTNFQDLLTKAEGQSLQRYQEVKDLPGGLEREVTKYFYGNTPEQFKESLLSSFHERQVGEDAERLWTEISPETAKAVDEKFRSIPLETWRKMGVEKPQDLIIRNADNKQEALATHYAQLYALTKVPRIERGKEKNEAAIDARNFAQQKELKNYEHALKLGDEEEAGKWVDKYLNGKKSEAQNNSKQLYVEAGTGWEMPLDTNLRKIFTVKVGGKEVEPDKLILKEDGKYVPIFYQYDKDNNIVHKDNGFPVVDYTLTVPHTQDDVKVAMGVKTGVKQLNVEMGGGTKKTRTVESSTKSTNEPSKKTIKASDIPAKAKAAGYTEKEYRALLKQNGVTIE